MKQKLNANSKGKKSRPKTKLGIPDLEMSKAAVLRSLGSPDSRRGYQHAIDEFVAWYCSEPRLAFNRTVVLRYRINLQERGLAPGTINVRMAAVRRLAYEDRLAGSIGVPISTHRTVNPVTDGTITSDFMTTVIVRSLTSLSGDRAFRQQSSRSL